MKYCLAIILICVGGAVSAFAQQTFALKEASRNFDVKIAVENCESDSCEGKGTVYLLKKNRRDAFQTIRMPNIFLELGENRRPTANLIELYGMNNSGIVFEDFNFDGAEDLAVRNGNEGGYGGPSYDVFLYSKQSGKFIKNAALTKLASEFLGLFRVDKNNKTIETFDKSGCCWHQTTRYRIVNDRPVKIYVLTEDASGGEWILITTEKLVGGKWRTSTKKNRGAN